MVPQPDNVNFARNDKSTVIRRAILIANAERRRGYTVLILLRRALFILYYNFPFFFLVFYFSFFSLSNRH